MDWGLLVTFLLGLGGLLVGLINTASSLSISRANRYHERSIQLHDHGVALEVRGPLTGQGSSIRATEAHANLVARFEIESRANAALYLAATSRLDRPGSLTWSTFSLTYGLVLLGIAFTSLSDNAWATPAGWLGAAVETAIYGISAIVLISFGGWGLVRRLQSRKLRQQIGKIDDLSIEGVIALAKGVTSLTRSTKSQRMGGHPVE